ncbi:DUF7144 family membrane protein [Allonocardiopsis opalescens]|uniref:DUF7144 domain-containing protein n=1 Tax=Allonocardiopsis opalescens TaxID=1144618 RepID=A0A2T0PWD1_9ACTN|nr:hypothetical protein [Allonocardiopsis opalescens]PRX95668.1 hypothetical protein CLV72_109277 [Allonocardiopsis opalescens]
MRETPNGWAVFAATMMLVGGAFNIIHGAVALFAPSYFLVAENALLFLDFYRWGLLLGGWGVVMVLAGLALLSGRMWARVFAILLACLNAVAQLVFSSAYPLWTVAVIAVDIVVVYGLTAGWSRGRIDREATTAYQGGRTDATTPRPQGAHAKRQEESPHP